MMCPSYTQIRGFFHPKYMTHLLHSHPNQNPILCVHKAPSSKTPTTTTTTPWI